MQCASSTAINAGDPLGQHFGKARHGQPFGRDEQEVEAAFEVVEASLARILAAAARVDALGAEAVRLELGDLVFHQGDQRAHHQGHAAAGDPGELVAERLARAGRHHQQRVAALDHRAAHGLLVGAESREAEAALEQIEQAVRRRRLVLALRGRLVEQIAAAQLAEGLLGAMHLADRGVPLYARGRLGEQRRPAVGGDRRRRWRRDRSRGGFGRVPDHFGHVAFDAAHEGVEAFRAALDAFELRLPLAGHLRTFHLRMHDLDQPDAFLGGLERLLLAHDVFAFEQRLDDRRARRGSAQAALAHRFRQLLVIELGAGRLHGRQQRGFGQPPRRARAFLLRLDALDADILFLLQPSGKIRLRGVSSAGAGLVPCPFSLVPSSLHIQRLPAFALDADSRADEAIDGFFTLNGRDDGRDRRDVVRLPGLQQPPGDQIENFVLVRPRREACGRLAGGDDRVMVADLRVVDVALAELLFAGIGLH